MPRTRAACPALRVTPLAASSSSVSVTDSEVARCRSATPAVATRRASAARISVLVNRAAPATSYTLVPSVRRSCVRLVHAVAGRGQAHRRGGQALVGDQVDDGLDVLGGQVRGADLAVRLGAHVPDLPRRAVGLHLVADPVCGVPDPRGVDGR